MLTPLPHSWSINTWPPEVWPHNEKRARWLVRSQRDELVRAGCLARVGRELVVIGPPYDKWLRKQNANVNAYEFHGVKSPQAATG